MMSAVQSIVLGDLSGVQDFLFDVAVEGGGQARRLRARSLFISLVAEVAALRLTEAVEALPQMRERVVEHIAKLCRQTPDLAIELNCTGGYKAEIAVLYELGRALRLPVYYLHETFKTCVNLP